MSAPASYDKHAAYGSLVAHCRETALISSITGLVYWDEQTYCPPAARAYRGDQLAYLAGVEHRRRTAPELDAWLAELAESPLAADPESDIGCVVRQLRREHERLRRQPAELVEEIARTASASHAAWAEARRADDFAKFRPWLEKMLALRVRQAEAIGFQGSPYNALLEEYEPGETVDRVGSVLGELRRELTPLVAQIAAAPRQAPVEISRRCFPVERQEAFGRHAAAAIGFDFGAGRLDVTDHPFCGEAGPCDVRLTTRYREREFSDGFFSILHEAGHGLYEQGLPDEFFGLPTGKSISLGIHESQSRMWENLVGRSHGFWRWFFEPARAAFPEALSGVALDDWVFALNHSEPSLIRTEADEATYNLHICIRFDLEQALVEGDLAVADLPAAWNDAYRDTLGVVPPSDASGVLQDVHWSEGMFGYFPTYALGNLYAAQLFAAAERELGDLDGAFARGEFAGLLGWLRENVHRVGQRLTAAQLVERVTGAQLSPFPLLARLRAKFGGLYGFA